MRDLSEMPAAQAEVGNPPNPQPYYAQKLAEAWAAKLDDGKLNMAHPDARMRHSDGGKCARQLGYKLAGVPEDKPMDLAGRWITGLGSIVHERWQEVMVDAFPGSIAELKVYVEECRSAGHIDLYLPSASLLGEGRDDRNLLDLDGSDPGGLRQVLPDGVEVGAGSSAGVPGSGGSHPGGTAPGSSLPGTGLHSAGSPGAGHTGGEQQAGGGGEDALPGGAPVHTGESGEAAEQDESGVQGVRPDPFPSVAGGTVIELKSINGYGAKMAIGARGPAQGPRITAIMQSALNGFAVQADEIVIIYLAMENLSTREVEKLYGDTWEDFQKFCAEWTFTKEQYWDLAVGEVARFAAIQEVVDKGELPPRAVPLEMPKGARIVDPSKGNWTLVQGDQITQTGRYWGCSYCPFQPTCIADKLKGC